MKFLKYVGTIDVSDPINSNRNIEVTASDEDKISFDQLSAMILDAYKRKNGIDSFNQERGTGAKAPERTDASMSKNLFQFALLFSVIMILVGIFIFGRTILGFSMFFSGTILLYEVYYLSKSRQSSHG